MKEIDRAKSHIKKALALSEKHTGTPAEEITRHAAQALNCLNEANEKAARVIYAAESVIGTFEELGRCNVAAALPVVIAQRARCENAMLDLKKSLGHNYVVDPN